MQVRVRGQLSGVSLHLLPWESQGLDSGLVAGLLSHLAGLGLVIFEGGKRMRTTQMASVEQQWKHSGRRKLDSLEQVTP